MTISVYDPCGFTGVTPRTTTPSWPSLASKRIGVLDNGKPHALLLMSEMAKLLAERTGAVVSLIATKRTAAEPAPRDLIAQFVASCDVVLTGSADCGSCTSWSIFDVNQLEEAGVVAVGVTTTAFEPISLEAARTLGRLTPRLLAIIHPLGGIGEKDVRARAAQSVERLIALCSQ